MLKKITNCNWITYTNVFKFTECNWIATVVKIIITISCTKFLKTLDEFKME